MPNTNETYNKMKQELSDLKIQIPWKKDRIPCELAFRNIVILRFNFHLYAFNS